MDNKLILLPMFAMVLLVCFVAGAMLRQRIAYMKTNRVHPQKLATSTAMATAITDSRTSDNFRNLFETPVLFYTIVLTIFVTKLTSPLLLVLAWAYVVARGAHSLIHCTTNIVMHRFYAFLASCALLLLLWLARCGPRPAAPEPPGQ